MTMLVSMDCYLLLFKQMNKHLQTLEMPADLSFRVFIKCSQCGEMDSNSPALLILEVYSIHTATIGAAGVKFCFLQPDTIGVCTTVGLWGTVTGWWALNDQSCALWHHKISPPWPTSVLPILDRDSYSGLSMLKMTEEPFSLQNGLKFYCTAIK